MGLCALKGGLRWSKKIIEGGLRVEWQSVLAVRGHVSIGWRVTSISTVYERMCVVNEKIRGYGVYDQYQYGV